MNPTPSDPNSVEEARELYWHNVVRELLTSLSALSLGRAQLQTSSPTEPADANPDPYYTPMTSPPEAQAGAGQADEAEPPDEPTTPAGALPVLAPPFDGRIGVVTRTGQRIAIAEVHPLFACSVPGSDRERKLSAAVQCTVFQIRTPGGEVYTLPLHEIRGIHALTPELLDHLTQRQQPTASPPDQPFGFAAFTSLAQNESRTPGAT